MARAIPIAIGMKFALVMRFLLNFKHMKTLKFVLTALLVLITMSVCAGGNITSTKKVKILLIGDSTTEGGKLVFENSIQQLIAEENIVPMVEVINVGLGGETAYSLLNSGRYDNQIKGIDSVDYIFVRYGINDWLKRQPFDDNFPTDMKNVITKLRNDFPSAQIILMTIIPFLNEQASTEVNNNITQIAKEENLELFDIYTPYLEKVKEFGRNSLTVRFFPLSDIPENYRNIVAPFTKFYAWKDADWVRVQTNEFDPLFGDLPDWYKDSHPNITGYRLIADETAKYIIPILKKTK